MPCVYWYAVDLEGNIESYHQTCIGWLDNIPPDILISNPEDGEIIVADTIDISGYTGCGEYMMLGSGVQKLEVSTDGGATWNFASLSQDIVGYEWGSTSCAGLSWSYTWSSPSIGSHLILVRSYDYAGNVENLTGPTINVTTDDTPPASAITSPSAGSVLSGATYSVTGNASDDGTGVALVEVSTDGGATWNTATGTTSWSYDWSLPFFGAYNIRTRATDASGNRATPGDGLTINVDNAAPAPVSVTAVDTPADEGSDVTINWNGYSSPSDFGAFKVYRGTAPFTDVAAMSPLGAPLTNPSARTYHDTTAVNGTDYWYAVTAVDEHGNENKSVASFGPVHATDNNAPDAVLTFSASDTPADSGGSVSLAWAGYLQPADLAHYAVYRETAPIASVSGLTPVATIDPGVYVYADNSAADGTGYYYAVVAEDTSGNRSNPVSAGPVSSKDNILPTVGIVTLTRTQINETFTYASLIWNSDKGGDYVLRVNGVAAKSGTVNAYAGNNANNVTIDLFISESFLTEGANTLTVTVTDPSGNVGSVEHGTALTVDRKPAKPTGVYLTYEAGQNRCFLTWYEGGEPDIDHYNVYEFSTSDYQYHNTASVPASGLTEYLDTTVNAGQNPYLYYVRSVDTGGNQSDPSAVASFDKNNQPAQVVVDSLGFTVSKWGEGVVQWHVDQDITDYAVEVGGTGTRGSGTQIASGGSFPLGYPLSATVRPVYITPSALYAGTNTVYIYVTQASNGQTRSSSTTFEYVAGFGNASFTPPSGSPSDAYTFSVDYFDPSPAGTQDPLRILKYMIGDQLSSVNIITSGGGINTCTTYGLAVGAYNYECMFVNALGKVTTCTGTGPTVSKSDSTVTAGITGSNSIAYGNTILVSGTVTGFMQGTSPVVTLHFKDPNSVDHPVAVQTTAGAYSYVYNEYKLTPMEGDWTVEATWNGDLVYNGASSGTPATFHLAGAVTTVALDPLPSAKTPDSTVNISGRVTPSPNVGDSLDGLPVTIYFEDPSGTSVGVPVETMDSTGYFELNGCALMTDPGKWHVRADFTGDARYLNDISEIVAVDVAETAGYAIIVQGRAYDGYRYEGLAEHNVTTNFVYNKLLERGLNPDDIMYFNYNVAQGGVDAAPTEAGIADAIQDWALGKMNTAPGPLYIVFVSHAEPGLFRIYQSGDVSSDQNNITPAELDGWLDQLESGLDAGNADSLVYFIDGSCSGR
ncbi:MAG: hypothetical protein HZC51_10595 [Nitrospirae bacterium]|nr:hypothetical protein [Nitrospirota bacterium]